MIQNHKCFVIKPRATDYIKGINSPIVFKSIVLDGNWTLHQGFYERQKFTWDNDGCICYAAQESFDGQVDALMPNLDPRTINIFNQMGFMDVGLDGAVHFHSSPRFLEVMTGHGMTGNTLYDPWDVMRKYGILPWKDLPFDSTITEEEYFQAIPQSLLDKAVSFLIAIGGTDAIQYHWINNGGSTNTQVMDMARPQAPLCVAVLAEAPDWNQYEPPIIQGPPCHGVENINGDGLGDEDILDHYDPFIKRLVKGWNIQYVLQGVVNIVPPLPPVLPPSPTPVQVTSWLDSLPGWLKAVLQFLKVVKN